MKVGVRRAGLLLVVWAGLAGGAMEVEPGRVLVKVTAAGERMLENARQEGGTVLTERIPKGILQETCVRYGIVQWEPLFPQAGRAESGGLHRIYRLRFGLSADPRRVARDFEMLTEWVEYAEPDQRVRIQRPKPSVVQ